ncbi:MAG: hypothetical protein EA382_17030 [Spirochaetaceae bacterium]|nr:MAG: hypothetical protein EA382_17030 [Spirochaetaceae bacterium]
MKHTVLAGLLFVAWIVFIGAPDFAAIVLGLVVSVTTVIVIRTMTTGERWLGRVDRPLSAAEPAFDALSAPTLADRLRSLGSLIVFVPVFAAKIVASGANLAFLALKPTMDFWPGIVRVHGGLPTVSQTAVFAGLITLTPGTLTLDYDPEGDDLYVHWIDVTGYGDVTFDDRVTSGLREWVRRISP